MLRETIIETLENIETVVFAYLFGSHARGAEHPGSDVDVAVYLEKEGDFAEEKLRIIGALTEALNTDAVDVVILNTAPTALVGRTLESREVLIDHEPFRRHLFESLMIRQYLDFHVKETQVLEGRFGLGR